MINWNKLNKEDLKTINKIVRRAVNALGVTDLTSASTDIEDAHIDCPMKLQELLMAGEFDFAHDIRGIINCMNRHTGKLENCFVPLCKVN